MSTPLAIVAIGDGPLFISPPNEKVRLKRFYFQPGERGYCVEATYKHDGWRNDSVIKAPGRGSTGVHEAGFGRFNTETLSLNSNAIPTLQVVDDTFTKHSDTMAAIILRAKERAGIA